MDMPSLLSTLNVMSSTDLMHAIDTQLEHCCVPPRIHVARVVSSRARGAT